MPRIQPTTKIDVIGNLDLSPEDAVGQYVESKQQEQYFIKQPNWDSAGDTIELFFVRNEREHEAMLRLQEQMLENQRRQNENNALRIERMQQNQEELKLKAIEVTDFIRDCEGKRKLAEIKVKDQLDVHKEIQAKVDRYRSSIQELSKFREKLESTVKEFEPYEALIEKVVEKSEIFDSVEDCMYRCDALLLAQVEISKLESEKIHGIEEIRKRMVKLTTDAAQVALGLKNELIKHNRLYAMSRAECHRWEKILTNAKDFVAQNDLSKARCIEGVNLMYRLLCRRRHMEPSLQRNDIEQQMDFIKSEVELLREVYDECHKLLGKNTKPRSTRVSLMSKHKIQPEE